MQSRYRVCLITLAGGDLLSSFSECADIVIGPVPRDRRNATDLAAMLLPALGGRRPRYAIVNSIECRSLLSALADLGIPRITLVHEFAAYRRPSRVFGQVSALSDELVFSAQVVRDNAVKNWPDLGERRIEILPQGRSVLPKVQSLHAAHLEQARVREAMRRDQAGVRLFVVLGCGSVILRKGVDLFLAVAQRVCHAQRAARFRFVWVGDGYDPTSGSDYALYLEEQIGRSGIAASVEMLDEVVDLDEVFSQADLFLLSSRLDPLPNVAIDAMTFGVPVVCFDLASGIADILRSDPATADCVVPYGDVTAAADCIQVLADDPHRRVQVAEAVRRIAADRFDMERYVSLLDRLGRCLRAVTETTRARDFAVISEDESFDAAFFLQPQDRCRPRAEAIHLYLAQSPTAVTNRKPAPGFHPGVYVEAGRFEFEGDAFADFLRRGKPAGPWLQQVLTPSAAQSSTSAALVRVGLHLHLYYPELLPDMANRLAMNAMPMDLLISVSSSQAAAAAGEFSALWRGKCTIRVVPNRGRDLGPMLTEFGDDLRQYDLICHVHAKKSPQLESIYFVSRWREFIFEHLLGGRYPMADKIISAMHLDSSIGLLYPDDPYLVGWTENRPAAEHIARKLGIQVEFPHQIDFPVGSMFWARPTALAPLLDAALDWEDYPEEPMAGDGTMLHAIERLLPTIVRAQGYRTATVHVPGIGR